MMSQQTLTKEEITDFFRDLQDRICHELETADGGARFGDDRWERSTAGEDVTGTPMADGGGGRSRTLADGAVIEKGGVGFSAVRGRATEAILRSLKLDTSDGTMPTFYATGVSIVLHPRSPMVPIIHMNVRYFELSTGHHWFGGGIDLTPHYVVPDDARWFHQQLKAVCDRHPVADYARFRNWADDYFYSPHRQETRGIGGIFFDHLKPSASVSQADLFAFVQDVGNAFAPIYTHFMHQNRDLPYGDREKNWQMLRRGRYVEFNLVWDRGTRFGLETNGRTESILMSMPPQANWVYDYQPAPDSAEVETLRLLRKGINWV